MAAPRRQKLLLLLLLVLLPVAIVYGVVQWRGARKHAAHWANIAAKGEEAARLNGPAQDGPINELAKFAQRHGAPLPPEDITGERPNSPRAEAVAGPPARFEPVHLLWKKSDWEGAMLCAIDGCLPIAADTDLIWRAGDLFLMREPGRLEHLWSEPAEWQAQVVSSPFERGNRRLCFDGRYVWLTSGSGMAQKVMVIEPSSKQSWEFGRAETGLLSGGSGEASARIAATFGSQARSMVSANPTAQITLAPVAPGVVCACIRTRQTWLALLRFNPDQGQREIEPIELPPALDLSTVSQTATYMAEGMADGQPLRRLVIGRGWMRPIVLDPLTARFSVASGNSSSAGIESGHWCLHDGAIWWQRKWQPTDQDTTLLRATLPDLKEEVVLAHVPSALLASYQDGILLLGKDVWLLNARQGSPTIAHVEADYFWRFLDHLYPPPSPRPPTLPAVKKVPHTVENFFFQPPLPELAGRMRRYPLSVWRSAVYGLLFDTISFYGEVGQVYRLSINEPSADQAESTSTATADGVQDFAPTVTRLRFAAHGSSSAATAKAALIQSPTEPERPHLRQRLPILARELVRQSLWLAARSQAGCTVRDEVLGESLADDAQAAGDWILSCWFADDARAGVLLESAGEPDRPVWKERLDLSGAGGMLDYLKLMAAAETWSRSSFPEQLRGAAGGEATPAPLAAEVSETAERELGEMTFPAQFAVVRRCGATPPQAAPPEALGRLVRAYANLGLLTEHHWTMCHKVFQARALLYAQRMVVDDPRAATAYWHRAYALLLAGLPGAAQDDLAQAERLSSTGDGQAVSPPPWVDVIAAACRYDDDSLVSQSQDAVVGQLAGLLRFLQLSRLEHAAVTSNAAHDLLKHQPECYRVYDSLCDVCTLDEASDATRQALDNLRQRLPARLRGTPEFPASVGDQLAMADDGAAACAQAAETLLNGVEGDACDLSWAALGSLIRETLFQQCWRHTHYAWLHEGPLTSEWKTTLKPLVAHHPCRRLFEFYADRGIASHDGLSHEQKAAAAELIDQLRLNAVADAQQRVYDFFFGAGWQIYRPEHYLAAYARVAEHRDDVFADLLDQLNVAKRAKLLPSDFRTRRDLMAEYRQGPDDHLETARRLNLLQPGNPEALGEAIEAAQVPEELAAELVSQHRHRPHVMRALARTLGRRHGAGQEALREYAKLSPDDWAFEALAEQYLEQENVDLWQATLDEFLAHQTDAKAARSLRQRMASRLIERGHYAKALPYAEALAAKNDQEGMQLMVHCYEGLGEDELEGQWHERLVDRFASGPHARDHYLWSRRTGLGDAELLAQRAMLRIGDARLFFDRNEQLRNAAFFWLAGRLDEAKNSYELAASTSNERTTPAFCRDCLALIAQQSGDTAGRDELLKQVAARADADLQCYQDMASWFALGLENKKLDSTRAEQLAAEAAEFDQPALNFLIGYAFLVVGPTQDGVPFLERAATLSIGARSTSRILASAALRERGLLPGKLLENGK